MKQNMKSRSNQEKCVPTYKVLEFKPKKTEITDGFTIKYHANGITKWSKGKMLKNKPHGYWEWYRPDGTLKRSGLFNHGEPVGEWTTYDAQGKVYKVTNRSKPEQG